MQRSTRTARLSGLAVLAVVWGVGIPGATAQNSILVREPSATAATQSPRTGEPPRRDSDEGFLSLSGPAGESMPAATSPTQSILNQEVSRRSVCQVALQATVDSPKQMHVGSNASIHIEITNDGDSPSKATRVYIGIPPTTEFISASPAPLSQTTDRLEFGVDALPAGGALSLELVVRPTAIAELEFQVLTMPVVEQTVAVSVTGPSVTVQTLSPREAMLQSQFIQGVMIENPSSTEVTNVAVTAHIPEGLNIAKLNRDAEIDMESRIVTWRLERLSPQAREAFQFIAVAESPGAQLTKLTVVSDGAAAQTVELATEVTATPVGTVR